MRFVRKRSVPKDERVGPPIYEAWVKVKRGLFTVEEHKYLRVWSDKDALEHLVNDLKHEELNLKAEEFDRVTIHLKPTGGVH